MFTHIAFVTLVCIVLYYTIIKVSDWHIKKTRPPYLISWDIEEKEKGLAYLEALNEMNIEMPTSDPEEKRLEAYLKAKKDRELALNDPKNFTVGGAFTTLLAPGLKALRQQDLLAQFALQDMQDRSGLNNYQQMQNTQQQLSAQQNMNPQQNKDLINLLGSGFIGYKQ
jgi:hypothetical protein